jgi:hypothetical protein
MMSKVYVLEWDPKDKDEYWGTEYHSDGSRLQVYSTEEAARDAVTKVAEDEFLAAMKSYQSVRDVFEKKRLEVERAKEAIRQAGVADGDYMLTTLFKPKAPVYREAYKVVEADLN